MFSGIIDRIGEVRSCQSSTGGMRLVIRADGYWSDCAPGASIAVDGACLTIDRTDDRDAQFDVIAETVRRTTLGKLRPGAPVNLQKSLVVGDRIDGHFVQGHVDAVGVIAGLETAGGESIWRFAVDPAAMTFIIPKGSVAVDGISLTVAVVGDNGFSVALIPTTLRETTLGRKRIGDWVNIETDVLARTVVRYLQSVKAGAAASTDDSAMMRLLRDQGFA